MNTPANKIGAAVSSAVAQSTPPTPTPPRDEDPRTRAARRAAELRQHTGGAISDDDDIYYIDPKIIPDGWSYEWKRHAVLGQADPSYEVSLAQKGWEAVPRSRHPFLMPENHQGETIERRGMILMERPLEITNEVKAHELRKARAQVGDKEKQLGAAAPGEFERGTHPQTKPKITKTYEAMPIPDK